VRVANEWQKGCVITIFNMTSQDVTARIKEAATPIRSARYLTTFTGAGIRTESGIPPFRGDGGLWSRDDDHFGKARPNRAREVAVRGKPCEARTLLALIHYENGTSFFHRTEQR